MQTSFDQIIRELNRELATREHLYPVWVANGKITRKVAEHRIQCIKDAIELLNKSRQKAIQPTLFGDF